MKPAYFTVLAHVLAQASVFGKPEKFRSGKDAEKGISGKRGVVAFFKIHPDRGDTMGHIDLVGPASSSWGELACAGACYWQSSQVWFWPLH